MPLSQGNHSFPFTFHVPRNLPPTLFASYGAVNHRIRARIKRAGSVPNLLHRMKGAATTRVNLVVHNSDHHLQHQEPFNRPESPDDPPAYSSGRRQWSGKRRNGAIDWSIQGPECAHISHRVEILANLRIAKGYGTVSSATVDLVQAEKYVAEPDPTVWTYPLQEQMTDDETASGSDDGYPETRTMGVKLKKAVAITAFGGKHHGISRENVCSFNRIPLISSDVFRYSQSQRPSVLPPIRVPIIPATTSISPFPFLFPTTKNSSPPTVLP